MALLWMDGFDQYGTGSVSGTLLARNYTVSNSGTGSMVTGRFGVGYSLNPGLWANTLTKQSIGGSTNSTFTIGLAVRWTAADPGGSMEFMSLYDGTTKAMMLMLLSDGRLRLRAGSGLTTIVATSTFTVTINTWYYLELQVICSSASNYTYELRCGGTTLFSGSATNKLGADAYVNGFQLYGYNWKNTWNIDDIYVTNGATGFLGNVRVKTLYPNDDGDTLDWTPSTGSDHFAVVDENPANDDTDYVSDSTSGHVDLFITPNLSSISSIKGVLVGVDCKESGNAATTIKIECVSDTTVSDSAALTCPITNYTCVTNIWETDPNTGSAWNTSDFNDAQFGVKIP